MAKIRMALTSTDTIDKRWGVMVFGFGSHLANALTNDMPLIKQVSVNVSEDYWTKNAQHEDYDYERWASTRIVAWLERGFDVLAILTGGANDLKEDLPTRALAIAQRLETETVANDAGKILGFCFDLEWENKAFSHGGWQAYVDYVSNALIAMEEQYPQIRRFGPGGTHSDDTSLPNVLSGMEELGASFTNATYHAYHDKGWKKWDKRAKELKEVFKRYGFDTVSITECGVTGEEDWGHDGRSGDPQEVQCERFGDMKGRIDGMDHVKLMQIYQISEGNTGEVLDHGIDAFGMFTWDMCAKPVTWTYYKYDE